MIVVVDPVEVTVSAESRVFEVSTSPKAVNVLTAGIQGPQGPSGVSADKITKNAITNLGGHRVVVATIGGVEYADSADVDHIGRVLGITLGAVTAGNPADIIVSGEVVEASWNFVNGAVYVGSNGLLTQSPPSSGFSQIVGVATSATSLVVSLKLAVVVI